MCYLCNYISLVTSTFTCDYYLLDIDAIDQDIDVCLIP